MEIRPSYFTAGGILELGYRLLWLVVSGSFLVPYFTLDNRQAFDADPTAWSVILLTAGAAFVYHSFRLINVFFQKMSFKNGVLTLRPFMKTYVIPREHFGSMWISYNKPDKKHGSGLDRFGFMQLWQTRIGFNQWKTGKKLRAKRIGNGWKLKELAAFLSLVNGKETSLLGWNGGYKLDKIS